MKKTLLIIVSAAVFTLLIFFTQKKEAQVMPEDIEPVDIQGHEIIAQKLQVPWSIAFLPDGDLLVTERSGILRVIGQNPKEIFVSEVVETGEGGLLGLALHPEYERNQYIYVYYTTVRGKEIINTVMRYVFDGTVLRDQKNIIEAIPGGQNHNGGRIAFGPDGMLYITTGDAGLERLAQDTRSLAGKILRVHEDGSIPRDNPFGNAVYSYGHRNPQGITWDSEGALWETEHGRSGVASGYDEINLIEKGANYGWPLIEGDETREGMKAPYIHSGSKNTWAPSGIAYHNGYLYFVGLRGRAVYTVAVSSAEEQKKEVKEYFKDTYGRLRSIAFDTKGNLYIGTSNTDGRGDPKTEDDILLKLPIPLSQ